MDLILICNNKRDKKNITSGFDWPAFFSIFILGIPHILRKQLVIGVFLFVLNVTFYIPYALPFNKEFFNAYNLGSFIFVAVLAVYFGLNGSKLYVKQLIECGYCFEDEDSDISKFYKIKWGIL